MTTCRRHPEDSPRHPEESPRTALINALSIQGYPERETRPCSLMASKPRIKIYRKFYLIVSLLFLFWHSSLFEQIDLNHFFLILNRIPVSQIIYPETRHLYTWQVNLPLGGCTTGKYSASVYITRILSIVVFQRFKQTSHLITFNLDCI